MEINRIIDHTLLKPESTEEQIEKIVKEAMEYNFFSVCVNPIWVKKCSEMLKDSGVKVCTVIGFPLGANTKETKAFETKNAIENGADEIDMVINIDLDPLGFRGKNWKVSAFISRHCSIVLWSPFEVDKWQPILFIITSKSLLYHTWLFKYVIILHEEVRHV